MNELLKLPDHVALKYCNDYAIAVEKALKVKIEHIKTVEKALKIEQFRHKCLKEALLELLNPATANQIINIAKTKFNEKAINTARTI